MYDLCMTAKRTPKLLIFRGNGFDNGFTEYHADKRLETLRTLVNERRFTAGETNIAYRILNHWDQAGLLPEGVKDNAGWRKFTLVELVWLRVVCRLREFGMSLDKIVCAKTGAMRWDSGYEGYPYFEYYVAKAWRTDLDPYVYVSVDGEGAVASATEFEASAALTRMPDVLRISLKSILEEMGLNSKQAKRQFSLTPNEVQLLIAVRDEAHNEVKADIGSDGEIRELETVSTLVNPPPNYQVQSEIEDQKMYGQVATQYVGGVRRSMKITRKRRLTK